MNETPEDTAARFQIDDVDARRIQAGQEYLEFLRSSQMSVGLYALSAGAQDKQSPHLEDEVYYVVRGKGRFECEGRITDIGAGSVLFVPAHADHRFRDIVEDLSILVVFAPPESPKH